MTAPIVIVAPCPLGVGAFEGWMSRIRSVDRIFEGQRRIYLDFVSGNAPAGVPVEVNHGEASEYSLDMMNAAHRRFVETLIVESRFVYVHTVHLARFLLPYYITGKIVTDIHGIVPEEERMLGRAQHGEFYEAVECAVMLNSRLLVVVTEAMRDHLMEKHPDCRAEFLIAPIIELYNVDIDARSRRKPGDRYRAVYAGGTQAWQNIDEMLAICEPVVDICDFDFLSHEHAIIAERVHGRELVTKATFRQVDKKGLAEAYLKADFGFVLRDPVAVNTVSCPTKLSEYLWFGVLPVVKSPAIGDFERMGYAYLTMENFSAGLFPDDEVLGEMRTANRAIVERLSGLFAEASNHLAGLSLPSRLPRGSLAGLAVGSEHLVYPNQAEVYLFADEMSHRVQHFSGGYGSLQVQFDSQRTARILRLVPLLASMSVKLSGVTVTLAEGSEAPHVTAHCPGQAAHAADGVMLRLEKAAPYVDIVFDRDVQVSAVSYLIQFESFGLQPTLSTSSPTFSVNMPVRFNVGVKAIQRMAALATTT
jgi:hypothetical protein